MTGREKEANMSEIARFGKVDAAGAGADRAEYPPAEQYSVPRILEIGSTTKMIRGGGGGSGQDCRYYYYYESGPYGC
jgi:hypothetical protein